MKRWLTLIVVVVVLIVVLGGIKGFGVYKMVQGLKAQAPPKAVVSTVKVALQDWQPALNAIGTLRAVQGADLSAEVNGIVDATRFESGAEVKAGQLLAQLRSGDDVAHLESLKASAALAEINYKRDLQQLKAQAISQATLDTSAANLRIAQAQVAEQQALVNKKFVRAPFDGKVGIRAVDVGQYLSAGTLIVTLQSLDPIYADFYLPQQSLAKLAEGQTVNLSIDNFPGKTFSGQIAAINPQVDAQTRNVQIRATLKNADHLLLPGMYTHLAIEAGKKVQYLTLPQAAITYNPYGSIVFLLTSKNAQKDGQGAGTASPTADKELNGDGTNGNGANRNGANGADDLVANQVFVTTGPTRGDQVAILKGLKEGDIVVTSGQLKLRNGAAVTVDNSVVPANDPNAQPADDPSDPRT